MRYTSFGDKTNFELLDSKSFLKFCKESGIVTKTWTVTDVDLAYTKAKGKGEKRIRYDEFCEALIITAAGKYKTAPTVDDGVKALLRVIMDAFQAGQLCTSSSTRSDAADADVSRLQISDSGSGMGSGPSAPIRRASSSGMGSSAGSTFDRLNDESTFTGQYRERFEGDKTTNTTAFIGNTNTKTNEKVDDISQVLRPGKGPEVLTPARKKALTALQAAQSNYPELDHDTLQPVFIRYCMFGDKNNQELLDSKNFLKWGKDTGLVSGRLTTTDMDLIYTKVKQKGERRINYSEWCASLYLIADKKCAGDIQSVVASAVPQ